MMYALARLTALDGVRCSLKAALAHPDPARHGGLLENLAQAIGRLMARWIEVGRVDDGASLPQGERGGSSMELRRNPAGMIFWEALDPIERDAFRSVAFP